MGKSKNNEAGTATDGMATGDSILTMSECARRAGKSPQTIRRWIFDGLLQSVRHPTGLPGVRESEFNKFYGNCALAARGV